DDADVAAEVHERLRVELLRIDDRGVDVGEDLEFLGAADGVAVARRAVGNDLLAVDFAHLPGLERLDHFVRLGHPPDSFVALYAHCSLLVELSGDEVVRSNDRPGLRLFVADHVFWMTILGKTPERSSACLAMRAAILRAIWR